jgi:hypothetical protein
MVEESEKLFKICSLQLCIFHFPRCWCIYYLSTLEKNINGVDTILHTAINSVVDKVNEGHDMTFHTGVNYFPWYLFKYASHHNVHSKMRTHSFKILSLRFRIDINVHLKLIYVVMSWSYCIRSLHFIALANISNINCRFNDIYIFYIMSNFYIYRKLKKIVLDIRLM